MFQHISPARGAWSTLLVAAAISMTGCSSSFQTTAASTSACGTSCVGGNASGVTDGSGNGSTPADNWKALDMDGSLNGGRFSAKQVVGLDKATKELLIKLPMPANPYIDGAMIDAPIPDLPGAHLTIEPIEGGGSSLVLRVPLKYLVKGVDFLPSNKLPNGDPLPAIPDGEAPSLAVQLSPTKNITATVYLNVATVGVFVNTPFDPMIYLSIPIKNKDQSKTLGYLTSVPAKQKTAKDGGFFLSVRIPEEISRIIDDNL